MIAILRVLTTPSNRAHKPFDGRSCYPRGIRGRSGFPPFLEGHRISSPF